MSKVEIWSQAVSITWNYAHALRYHGLSCLNIRIIMHQANSSGELSRMLSWESDLSPACAHSTEELVIHSRGKDVEIELSATICVEVVYSVVC